MKYLISYANNAYRDAQKLNSKTGRKYFDKVIEYTENDIDKEFRSKHEDIFEEKRGNGLWLWKPYIIKKTLEKAETNDIVFYCDSGACFFRSPKAVFNILKNHDIWVTVLPLIEKQFTKKYTFEAMNCNSNKYMESSQISGSFLAIKKNKFTVEFVNEWLEYCCDKKILEPPKDCNGEMEGFCAHREDQSILSLLAKKYDIKPYSDPSQYGRLPEKYIRSSCKMNYYGKEDYKPFILHHRTKEGNLKILFRQWLCAVLPRTIGMKFIKM